MEAIEPGGVRLRSYFWFPARGVDRWKLLSDAQLAAKVALQKAGIQPALQPVQDSGDGLFDLSHPWTAQRAGPAPALSADQLQANLRHDTEAASIASTHLPQDQENEIGNALDIAKGSDEEGRNLLGDKG